MSAAALVIGRTMTAKNPQAEDFASQQVQETISGHWRLFLLQGLIMAALGLIAVAEPIVATFDVEIFLGWVLLIGGIVSLAGVFAWQRMRGFRWMIVAALLATAIGAYLVWRPSKGILSLTLAAAVFFGAQGIAQFVIAIGHRAVLASWVWLLLSGAVNFGLAVIILSGAPSAAPRTLGLMFGINLFLWGMALVMTALACRAIPDTPRGARGL